MLCILQYMAVMILAVRSDCTQWEMWRSKTLKMRMNTYALQPILDILFVCFSLCIIDFKMWICSIIIYQQIFFKAGFYITEQSNSSKLGKVEKPVNSIDKLFPSSYCKLVQKWVKEDKRSIIVILGCMSLSYGPNWKKKETLAKLCLATTLLMYWTDL